MTLGVGMFIGSYLSGVIVEHYVTGTGHDWRTIWLIPSACALGVLVLFALFFKAPRESSNRTV